MNLVLKLDKPAMLLTPDAIRKGDKMVTPLARLADFVPVCIKNIVLCLGPAEGRWPDDVTLMSRMLKPAQSRQRPAVASRAAVGGAMTCAMLLVVAFFSMLRPADSAHASEPRLSLDTRVHNVLARSGWADVLRVRDAGTGQVIVEGLLPDAQSVMQAHTELAKLDQNNGVVHKYAAASEISQSISDALNDRGLSVSYEGGGAFKVSGRVKNMDNLQQSARRISNDLAPLVARIDLDVAELPPPDHFKVEMTTGGVGYVQTGDGTKHIELRRVDPAASATAP